MARRINTSQIRSKLRQIQNEQKQAINKYNQQVRQYNRDVRRAVDTYNNEVRRHNARVRANQQKIITELRRFRSSTTIKYKIIRTSAITLDTAYKALDAKESEFQDIAHGNDFLDLSEKENANSLAVSNILEEDQESNDRLDERSLTNTEITNELSRISQDLHSRWKGALFSLNPNNPDASRHFCTSVREIFIQILDKYAPDEKVLSKFPNCEKTDGGALVRKWKIKYILISAGIANEVAVEFVDEDVKNILDLFRVLNDATHGASGHYEIKKLFAIKERVEDGILYLTRICNYA